MSSTVGIVRWAGWQIGLQQMHGFGDVTGMNDTQ
jgi:hypothetical protein